MATYVAVSNTPWDKAIKAGPFELDDPTQYSTQMGTHLMLESEALATGYAFAADGAFAAEQPDHSDDHGKHCDHGKHSKHGKHGDHGKQ